MAHDSTDRGICQNGILASSMHRAERLARPTEGTRRRVKGLIDEGKYAQYEWRAPRMRSLMRAGLSGMRVTRTPKGRSASSTAPATAAVTGIVPASPAPLTPRGLIGLGVVRWNIS